MPDAFIIRIVDDDEAVRHSLQLILEAHGYGVEAHRSAEALLAALDGSKSGPMPSCLLVDVHMPSGMDGLSLLGELQRRGTTIPAVVITGQGDVPMAVRAMRAGAVDFVEKPYDEDQLLAAVAAAAARSRDVVAVERRHSAAAAHIAALTPRERAVLRLLVTGLTNKLVAHELGLSPRTVEAYRASMIERLGVGSLAGAVRIALLAGLDDAGSTL